MDNIADSFGTTTETISEFFHRTTVGFVIPPYQRDYNWDSNNVEQLIDDIAEGVKFLLEDNENEIHYLGTVISVKSYTAELNAPKAIPTRVDGIIDGQQRITSIALLGTVLYERIFTLSKKLGDDEAFEEIKDWLNTQLQDLSNLFTVDLQSGKPRLKPKIIREMDDHWTHSGAIAKHYNSELASYLADVIAWINDKDTANSFPVPQLADTNVTSNLATMNRLIKKIEEAHLHYASDDNVIPPAWDILATIEALIWKFERPELRSQVFDAGEQITTGEGIPSIPDTLCRIVQLLTFNYYLMKRCCLTTINPSSLDWAFDMFQSLNATGTPLTAIETFKPEVVRVTNDYSKSDEKTYFDVIDQYMSKESDADKKAKLTNELLTTFAWAHEGKKLSRWLSVQRKWLQTSFRNYEEIQQGRTKTDFVSHLSDVATYYKHKDELDEITDYLPPLSELNHSDREIATLAVIFLEASNHSMSRTILSRFYSNALRNNDGAAEEFVEAAKAVAAFFTLWRAMRTNSGLPDVYKHILRGHKDRGYYSLAWTGPDKEFSATNLKKYLYSELIKKAKSKDEWLTKVPNYLTYDRAKTVCKFALLIVSQDTISDSQSPGLIKKAMRDDELHTYLTPRMWFSSTTRTLEHIAPQSKSPDWDPVLYEDEKYQVIGNLTLLPESINQILGNHSWSTKWAYLDYVTTKDDHEALDFEKRYGFKPKKRALEILEKAAYIQHLKPIVTVDKAGNWDSQMVKQRTENIANLLWDILIKWLQ